MKIEQLKKQLEPFIRKVVRDELRKQKRKQGLGTTTRAMGVLRDFGFGKKDDDDKKTEVEWTE